MKCKIYHFDLNSHGGTKINFNTSCNFVAPYSTAVQNRTGTIVISTWSLLALGVLWVIVRYALCYASAPAPPDLPSPSSPPPPPPVKEELTNPRLTRQEQSDMVIISQYHWTFGGVMQRFHVIRLLCFGHAFIHAYQHCDYKV